MWTHHLTSEQPLRERDIFKKHLKKSNQLQTGWKSTEYRTSGICTITRKKKSWHVRRINNCFNIYNLVKLYNSLIDLLVRDVYINFNNLFSLDSFTLISTSAPQVWNVIFCKSIRTPLDERKSTSVCCLYMHIYSTTFSTVWSKSISWTQHLKYTDIKLLNTLTTLV